MNKWHTKLFTLLTSIVLIATSQAYTKNANAICHNVHYDFSHQGGVCMPGNNHGFVNAAQCNKIYFCTLHDAYHQFIEEAGASIQKNNQLIQSKGPSKNAVFDTFDVQNGPFKTTYNGQTATNDLTWVTQYQQIRNKIISNATLINLYNQARNNPNEKKKADEALALYIHQLVGMPPLGYAKHSIQNPYHNSGLFIIHSNKQHSLNENNNNPDLNQLDTVNFHYNMLTPLDNRHTFVFRLCRSTYQLDNSKSDNTCMNNDLASNKLNPGYKVWTQNWVRGVYPSNILQNTSNSKHLCTGNGAYSCLSYYPWTSIGNTYNWSNFEDNNPVQGMYDGLHEYGIPGNTMLPPNQVNFVKLANLFQYLLTHPNG